MERSTIVSTIILPQIDYLYVVVLISSSYEYIKLTIRIFIADF